MILFSLGTRYFHAGVDTFSMIKPHGSILNFEYKTLGKLRNYPFRRAKDHSILYNNRNDKYTRLYDSRALGVSWGRSKADYCQVVFEGAKRRFRIVCF